MKEFANIICFLCLSTGSLAGQIPEVSRLATAQVPTIMETIKVRVDLTNVFMTVTDPQNHAVLGLTKNDFRLFEDNQPQKIRNFSAENGLPLRIAILVDCSYSVRDHLRFEEEAAIEFLKTIMRPRRDLAFVVAFSQEEQVWQDYTDDIEKLSKAFWSLHAAGSTLLYDAIYYSCKEKLASAASTDFDVKRLLILFSDGEDNQSQHTFHDALTAALRADVRIYAISTYLSGSNAPGDAVLRRFAMETGGRVFSPRGENELDANFQAIALELVHEYSLAYMSTNRAHDGSFRVIRIEPIRKDLRVRARTGYFTPSD
jgi:VWFA-related protein